MADSEAVRQRRRRLHVAGDHRLCRAARCEAARGQVDTVNGTAPDDAAFGGGCGAGVIDGLELEDFDPMWPQLDYTLALAMRFDRGEAVAVHLRPALEYLSRVASWQQTSRALRQGVS